MDVVEFRIFEFVDVKLIFLIFGFLGFKFGGGYGRFRYFVI